MAETRNSKCESLRQRNTAIMKSRLDAEQEIREKAQYHFLDKTVQRDLSSKKHIKKYSKDF